MRIFSLYVMLDDGRCIFNEYFTPEAPPKNLVTGMLTALQGFVRELTGVYPTILAAGGFSFFFEKRGPITIVMVTSKRHDSIDELSELSLRFLKKYGDLIEAWKGNVNSFEDFTDDVEEILGAKQTIKRIDPVNPLDGITLLNMDPELLEVAKAMLEHKEASSEELTAITGENEFLTRLKLEKLVQKGHLGRYQKQNRYTYFIS